MGHASNEKRETTDDDRNRTTKSRKDQNVRRKGNLQILNRPIGLVGRVFASGPDDLGSIPGRVIPKTLKMVLDTSLLNTQKYKVRIKSKAEQSWERSSTLLYTLV